MEQLSDKGADSVFSFIRRTAERDGARCRWKTVDYENKLQYNTTLFNGVGGIPLFLIDYARVRGNEEARDLARGALEWCAASAPAKPMRGLHFGQVGPAFSALGLDAGNLSPTVTALCERVDASLLREHPGPVTDLVGGASSNGFYLLRAWRKQGDVVLLNGAIRCGEWLKSQLIRDALGCHCAARPDGEWFGPEAHTGLAHGIAGVAFFFARLFEATRENEWKDLALEIFDTLIATAMPSHGGWNWSPTLGETDLSRCQWSHGSPGIGLAFLFGARFLGESRLHHAALMAGETTFHAGDFRKNPTLCTGLTGGGELLLELWRETGDLLWLERAHDFGRQILTYRVELPEGDAWPTDEPGLYSADFVYGAAGIGHFLLRLENEGNVPMALM